MMMCENKEDKYKTLKDTKDEQAKGKQQRVLDDNVLKPKSIPR